MYGKAPCSQFLPGVMSWVTVVQSPNQETVYSLQSLFKFLQLYIYLLLCACAHVCLQFYTSLSHMRLFNHYQHQEYRTCWGLAQLCKQALVWQVQGSAYMYIYKKKNTELFLSCKTSLTPHNPLFSLSKYLSAMCTISTFCQNKLRLYRHYKCSMASNQVQQN